MRRCILVLVTLVAVEVALIASMRTMVAGFAQASEDFEMCAGLNDYIPPIFDPYVAPEPQPETQPRSEPDSPAVRMPAFVYEPVPSAARGRYLGDLRESTAALHDELRARQREDLTNLFAAHRRR
jgi:hypothetical protein